MRDTRGLFLTAALVAAASFLLQAMLRTDPAQKNYELFPDMAHSRAAESFAPSTVLPANTTSQPPVEGVVVRGRMPLEFGPGPDEAKRAGELLADPLPAGDSSAVQRGRELYGIYCIVCHDARGEGQGRVVMRGMAPPPSLHGARATAIKDGELFHILSFGQGNMPSYAAQIEPEDRWRVIRFVRDLQKETQ